MDNELLQRTERIAKALDVLAKNAAAAEVRGAAPPMYLSLLKAAGAMKKRAGVLHGLDALIGSARSGMRSVGNYVGDLHGLLSDPRDMLANAVGRAKELARRSGVSEQEAVDALFRGNKSTKNLLEAAKIRVADEAAKAHVERQPSYILPAAAAIAAGGIGYGLGRSPNQQDRGRSNLPVIYAS